jgi:4-amino-4-deoxy-L-arabinose transferase-like glycosyltransferase
VLAGLVVFHAVNNWLWLRANETILGWDVPSHLGTSYIYHYMLRPLTLKTLFATIIWHPNRPPLPFLTAVPLYRVFGVSPDVGTMFNLFYLAVLLGAVYGIGQQMGGRRVGLLAAFVVATLPMIYAMSRYFYLELGLTATVALSIYLLLATDGFEKRSMSLLFGISLGLGLLTKRTYLAFMVAPLVLVVARSRVFLSLKGRLQGGLPIDGRDFLVALAVGLFLSSIWYLPAREITSQLPLGVWLWPLWALLITATTLFLRLSVGPDSNLLSALGLGATIGSLWYLPRINFVERLLLMGFGVNDPRERSANLDTLGTYFFFPSKLITEHLSPVTFGLLLIAVAGLVSYLLRRGSIRATLRGANNAWWVTTLWVIGAYLIFTVSIYRKSRGIVPVLPALALLLAAGLFRLPSPRFPRGLGKKTVALLVALVIIWGLCQFFVLTFPGPHHLAEATTFRLPLVGEVSVFARGGTIQLPASGETDPAYWVVPDLLESVEAGRQASGAARVQVGVLVNNEHVNPDLLGLIALQSFPGIQIQNLASTDNQDSLVPRLFEQDYLVLIDGDYMLIDAAAQEALQHLREAPGFFEAVFALAERFRLPDGDTVLLYRKAQGARSTDSLEGYRSAAEMIDNLGQAGDAILLVPPNQAEAVARVYSGSLTPYFLPDPTGQPLDPDATNQTLSAIMDRHPVLFALFREEEAVDPERQIESWLNEHAFRSYSEWFDGVRMVIYGAPTTAAGEAKHPSGAQLDGIRLVGYTVADETVRPGQLVRLALFWQAQEVVTEPLTVFAHLVDQEGQLVAQQDGEPAGGSRPTVSWSSGELVRDQRGILLPRDTPPGEYRLVVGLYRPDSGQRLLVNPGSGEGSGSGTNTSAAAPRDQIVLEDVPIRVEAP